MLNAVLFDISEATSGDFYFLIYMFFAAFVGTVTMAVTMAYFFFKFLDWLTQKLKKR